jgi:hypothetical protein
MTGPCAASGDPTAVQLAGTGYPTSLHDAVAPNNDAAGPATDGPGAPPTAPPGRRSSR